MKIMGELAQFEDLLLLSARNGDYKTVLEIIKASDDGKITLNINCKGKSKYNLGWTPLHLASYFGHKMCVEILLQNGADVDIQNVSGDTALHKAALTNREDIVMLLIEAGASVSVINGEAQKAFDKACNSQVKKMIVAAENAELNKREQKFLHAAREGDANEVKQILQQSIAPNINCTDSMGNTALHCCSYRDHVNVAVVLLQNGCDTTIKNDAGQTALDLVHTQQMQQILAVPPVRSFSRKVTRFEGPLLKRMRIVGWRLIWVVLERGVLTCFNSRADASSGVHRRDYKYLDGAKAIPSLGGDQAVFVIQYNDASTQRFAALSDPAHSASINRQKWVTALEEHIKFSTHYIQHGFSIDSDEDEEQKPLGCMEDSLSTAKAHYDLLEQQLQESVAFVSYLENKSLDHETAHLVIRKFTTINTTGRKMLSSLSHTLSLLKQEEEIRELRFKEEKEKVRVLEESLRVLANEHYHLEESIASELSCSSGTLYNTPLNSLVSLSKPRRYFASAADDEFFDAFSRDDDDGDACTLKSFPSPTDSECSTNTLLSCVSSLPPDDPKLPVERSATNQDLALSSSSSERPPAVILDPNVTFVGREEPKSPDGNKFKMAPPWKQMSSKPHLVTQSKTWGRRRLPAAQFQRNDFSMWSVLRQCIGKELSKITMPIVFNEPLSFLQRVSEYMEYAWLLEKADQSADPFQRMEFVTAFAVSGLASNWERIGKPFNPLLGETFELQRDQYRIMCEQVSHHPPVSAFYADSENWTFHGSIHPKLKFWGKSVEIQPKGILTIELPNHGEAYTWSNVNCCVHNIIVGKLWIEQYGTMEVLSHTTGVRSVLTFKSGGWFSKDLHRVEGFILDKNKKKQRFLFGKWTDFLRATDINSYREFVTSHTNKFRCEEPTKKRPSTSADEEGGSAASSSSRKVFSKLNSITASFKMSSDVENAPVGGERGPPEDHEEGCYPRTDSTYSIDIPNSVTLWEADPRTENSSQFYHFTLFAMSLNELDEDAKRRIAPSDSRLRPDIRLLEEGDIDAAATEKARLEEKQRNARKERRKSRMEYKSRWFDQGQNPFTQQEDWLYCGGYWDRKYVDNTDIF